jgi:hypothetical protein
MFGDADSARSTGNKRGRCFPKLGLGVEPRNLREEGRKFGQ